MMTKNSTVRYFHLMTWCFWCLLVVFPPVSAGAVQGEQGKTMDERYPGIARGILGSARLEPMKGDILLTGSGITIGRKEITDIAKREDPKMRRQLEKNLLFLLEQEAARRLLMQEAKRADIPTEGADENEVIRELFTRKAGGAVVTDEEIEQFYKANKELVGGAPFEQVKEGIRQYLLQEKMQQAVEKYIASLTESAQLRINAGWADSQSRLAADNPVDKARSSGRPTMVEFGAAGCVPCDMMQPILDNLRKNYPDTLNVVFIHVGEKQILGARYGIRSIPVQVFFDASGREVFRHVGFFPEDEVTKQLTQMGVVK